jgi:spermidine synthase
VIISDCTDPIGPGRNAVYVRSFYEGCKRCLKPGGIFVAQNGVCFLQQDEALDSHRKLSHLLWRCQLLSGRHSDVLRRDHDLCLGDG